MRRSRSREILPNWLMKRVRAGISRTGIVPWGRLRPGGAHPAVKPLISAQHGLEAEILEDMGAAALAMPAQQRGVIEICPERRGDRWRIGGRDELPGDAIGD